MRMTYKAVSNEEDSEEKIAATNAANVRKYGAVSIEEMSSSQME